MKITITDATDNTLAANELQGGYFYRDNQGDLFTLVLDGNSGFFREVIGHTGG